MRQIIIFLICNQKKYFIIIGILIFFVTIILWKQSSLIDDIDRQLRLKKIDHLIKSEASQLACKQPQLPLHSPEILKYVYTVPKIDCSSAEPDWVKCEGHTCTLQNSHKINNATKCSFTDIIRVDDYQLTDGSTSHTTEYILKNSDVVRVSCKTKSDKWSSILNGIRLDKTIWKQSQWNKLAESSLKLNVLMFGLDSLSRLSFIRKLPKTYKYLKHTLNAIVLEGYNIVGDGTPQALIPILTGKTELELPDTRKRVKDSQYVDSYPFIWNDFKDYGYVTGFFEDLPHVGTFTYRLNGFKDPPTHHYMRPYYLASMGEKNKWPELCTGNSPRHLVMLNAIKNFFSEYKTKPKFLFAFHGELSHDDYNLIGVADEDILQMLKNLKQAGALDNTLLILMADHGHRFAEIRNTLQGKQEERLPFFSLSFPKWFEEKYDQAYKNLKENSMKLTTPFDIYATLSDVLDLKYTGIADISQRSVSLFSQIPQERSCADAYIEPHWCACLDWYNISNEDPISLRLADALVDTINNYTEPYRNLCQPLKILHRIWTKKISPNNKLLKFNKNADVDGFVADLSAKMELFYETYQMKVMLSPGKSLFEASIVYDKSNDKIITNLRDISRINIYRKQAICIENTFPHLRKYCYCRNLINER